MKSPVDNILKVIPDNLLNSMGITLAVLLDHVNDKGRIDADLLAHTVVILKDEFNRRQRKAAIEILTPKDSAEGGPP